MRTLAAVVVGYAVWTALWLGGNRLFFAELAELVGEGRPFTEPGPLAAVLGLSLVCSLAAGAAAAGVAGGARARSAVLLTGGLLLLTGILVQASAWSLLPVWYHAAFLLLLLPVVRIGGRLLGARRASPA